MSGFCLVASVSCLAQVIPGFTTDLSAERLLLLWDVLDCSWQTVYWFDTQRVYQGNAVDDVSCVTCTTESDDVGTYRDSL